METGKIIDAPADTAAKPQLSWKQKFARAASDTVHHPAVLLSGGNTALTLAMGNPAGTILQGLTTLTLAGLTARASWKEQPLDLPFYALGAVNLATAGSGFYTGFPEDGLIINEQTRMYLLGNASLTGWGIGHILSGREAATGEKPKNPIKSNMTWYGGADVSAILANPANNALVPLGVTIGGFLKSAFSQNEKPPAKGSISWHATPARLYGAAYGINGILAYSTDPAFTAACLLWMAGLGNFDPEQNQALKESASRYIKPTYQALKDTIFTNFRI